MPPVRHLREEVDDVVGPHFAGVIEVTVPPAAAALVHVR
jgi:hypothetical protein